MADTSNKAIEMEKHHIVENISIENGSLNLLVDGKSIKRNLKDLSRTLELATEEELNIFEISPSGYGIYWPLIDEDISIDSLLGIKHHPHSNKEIV